MIQIKSNPVRQRKKETLCESPLLFNRNAKDTRFRPPRLAYKPIVLVCGIFATCLVFCELYSIVKTVGFKQGKLAFVITVEHFAYVISTHKQLMTRTPFRAMNCPLKCQGSEGTRQPFLLFDGAKLRLYFGLTLHVLYTLRLFDKKLYYTPYKIRKDYEIKTD